MKTPIKPSQEIITQLNKCYCDRYGEKFTINSRVAFYGNKTLGLSFGRIIAVHYKLFPNSKDSLDSIYSWYTLYEVAVDDYDSHTIKLLPKRMLVI